MPVLRINVRRRAAHDAFDHLEPGGGACRQDLAEEVKLAPGRPTLDIDVGAKAQRMHGNAHQLLDRADRIKVDDRDHLAGDIGEAVPGSMQDFGRPAQLIGAEFGEVMLNLRATFARPKIAARDRVPFARDGERMA